eukprot:Pompholyxophrys_sp_v1_NODE_16_length_4221_cov_20.931109.p3 type:complete len:116 gc:universal NODE_16_length_4221_cov_20.931109:2680-3027(+)
MISSFQKQRFRFEGRMFQGTSTPVSGFKDPCFRMKRAYQAGNQYIKDMLISHATSPFFRCCYKPCFFKSPFFRCCYKPCFFKSAWMPRGSSSTIWCHVLFSVENTETCNNVCDVR